MLDVHPRLDVAHILPILDRFFIEWKNNTKLTY